MTDFPVMLNRGFVAWIDPRASAPALRDLPGLLYGVSGRKNHQPKAALFLFVLGNRTTAAPQPQPRPSRASTKGNGLMTTKAFPTADVLSTITGRLMGDIGGVYQVLNWMTGESVYTHQIPRISREATPVVLAAYPELAAACSEAEQVTRDNWRDFLALWIDRYGETIEVPKFTADTHERIDSVSELTEMVAPSKIIVVSG